MFFPLHSIVVHTIEYQWLSLDVAPITVISSISTVIPNSLSPISAFNLPSIPPLVTSSPHIFYSSKLIASSFQICRQRGSVLASDQGGLWVFFYQWAFPSPPPWGWSTGFITTPLTTGRLPNQHLDPALPKLFWFTPTLPTCPTVAQQFWDTKRTSPDGNLKVANLPSFAISFATAGCGCGCGGNFRPSLCWLYVLKETEAQGEC